MIKLTESKILAMKYEQTGNKKDIRWDSIIKGFGIRVYPSGSKSFVLSYRVNNRKRLMTLGSHGTMTLKQAQDRSRKAQGGIIDDVDPMSGRDKRGNACTFKQLTSDYIELFAKDKKRRGKQIKTESISTCSHDSENYPR